MKNIGVVEINVPVLGDNDSILSPTGFHGDELLFVFKRGGGARAVVHVSLHTIANLGNQALKNRTGRARQGGHYARRERGV